MRTRQATRYGNPIAPVAVCAIVGGWMVAVMPGRVAARLRGYSDGLREPCPNLERSKLTCSPTFACAIRLPRISPAKEAGPSKKELLK